MTRHCAIHGAREVPDGPPNQVFKCDARLSDGTCNTLLTLQPHQQAPTVPTQNPTSDARPRAERSDKVFHQAAFLAAYAGGPSAGNITAATKLIGIDRSCHYDWLDDPEYERRFLEAHKKAIQAMVDRAQEIAFGGTPDTRLIVKMLESIPRHMMPAGWDFNPARRQELSGPGGAPIETNLSARDALASRISSLTTPGDTPSGN